MSKYKLSATLQIPIEEAADLIVTYFKSFPKISKLLNILGKFGVENGMIMTFPPFRRKRRFYEWRDHKEDIDTHIGGDYVPYLGRIERQSKNLPIQGTAADMMKLAMCMIYWYIEENSLWDKIHLVAQVHDQVTTTCVDEIADTWKDRLTELMEDAARYIIPSGLLKAETTISESWTK